MNLLLETAGQIAAIIICFFVFVFVILSVAFNLAMAFGMSWLSEKIQVIKMLRPTVESVNTAVESALEDNPPEQDQPGLLRTVASVPVTMHSLEKKVEQGTDKVAGVVIEFRARTVQAKTILKAFFLPGLTQKKQEASVDEVNLALDGSGSQRRMKERLTDIPVESPSNQNHLEPIPPAEQMQHASIR